MKYLKKPEEIDAMQWDGTLSGVRAIEAAMPTLQTWALTSHEGNNTASGWRIGLRNFGANVIRDDWIIADSKGDHHVCGDDIFTLTYDPAQAAVEPFMDLGAPPPTPLQQLMQDVSAMAAHGMLPDGDTVNSPTLLWAEEWARKLTPKLDDNRS